MDWICGLCRCTIDKLLWKRTFSFLTTTSITSKARSQRASYIMTDHFTTMDDVPKEFKHGSVELRDAAMKFGVNLALQRRSKRPIQRSGRRNCLNESEEQLIARSVSEFANSGTPLSKEGIRSWLTVLPAYHPSESQSCHLEIINGINYVSNIIQNTDLSFRRRANLEQPRGIQHNTWGSSI